MNLWQYRSEVLRHVKIIEILSCKKTMTNGFLFSLVFVLLMVFWITPAMPSPKGKPKFPRISLFERTRGERAIQVLTDKLPEVAAFYGSTPEKFCNMLRQDHTARIDIDGRLLFIDEAPEATEGG